MVISDLRYECSSAATEERSAAYGMPVPEAFGALLYYEGYGIDGELAGWKFSAECGDEWFGWLLGLAVGERHVWEPLDGTLGVAFAAGHFERGRLDGFAYLPQGACGVDLCGDCLGVVKDSPERYIKGREFGEEFRSCGDHVTLLLGGDPVGGAGHEGGDVEPFERWRVEALEVGESLLSGLGGVAGFGLIAHEDVPVDRAVAGTGFLAVLPTVDHPSGQRTH